MIPRDGEGGVRTRTVPGGFESWNAYWTAQRIPWRTEPEINGERQRYLTDCLKVQPDAERGVYPFKGIELTRADIEWLLLNNKSKGEDGPVDWGDIGLRGREGPDLRGAILVVDTLDGLLLARAKLTDVDFTRVTDFGRVHLEGATMIGAILRGKHLRRAHLEGADLAGAHLEGAELYHAHLEGTVLRGAHLESANLSRAHLERAELNGASLAGANLTLATMNAGTLLEGVRFSDTKQGVARVADMRWGDANLAVVDWAGIATLGDDLEAARTTTEESTPKDNNRRVREYEAASRANRQLATALRAQGFNEHADHFAHRAEYWHRKALFRQRKLGPWAVSSALAILSGYGFSLWRIVAAYGVVLIGFAVLYWLLGVHSHPHEAGIRALWDSFLVSLSAIHGRTTFEQLGPWSPAAWTAAIESVVGIVIEGVFVAMLVQRFFGGR